jgi:hypothetical protein
VKGAYLIGAAQQRETGPSIIISIITIAMAEGISNTIRVLSLEEQLSKFPAHLLDVDCADAHLVQLTECFSEWQTRLSASLKLTAVEVEDIEGAWPRDPAMQRVKMFRRWKGKYSSQATYRSVLDLPSLVSY